jgi:Right handed beta helix region
VRLNHHFFLQIIFSSIAITNISFRTDANYDTTTCSVNGNSYYFSFKGNDENAGTYDHPLKTIHKLNQLHLAAGDHVYLHGGDIFEGTIQIDSSETGSGVQPIIIGSYGGGKAIIYAGNQPAITVYKSQYIDIVNLSCKGFGRKSGNTKEGVVVAQSNNVSVDSLDISGFQKAGLLVYSSKDVSIRHVFAHDNGASGISVEGVYGQKDSHNIAISYCRVENNPGDPTNLTNHSGNGIVVGHCTKVLIEYCEATNNGWDMPRIGNGPVGIWGYEADSLTIEHCLSYRNKTSFGAADGGGFDLDGGVTNSIVQYCLSYENQGAGYCIFQYWGASPWHNNIFRYNISVDDGLVSDGKAGVYTWNSSGNDGEFYNCLFYNNTIYNTKEAALSYSETSKRKNFAFYNNIFIGKDSLVKGEMAGDTFMGNDWWSIEKKFNVSQISNLTEWAHKYNQESRDGRMVGLNVDPLFNHPASPMPVLSSALASWHQFTIPSASPLRQDGIDLHLLQIETGNADFNGHAAPVKGIGACF